MHTGRFAALAAALAALLLVAGCGSRAPAVRVDLTTPQPAPTVAPIFGEIPTATPRPAITRTPRPAAGRTATATAGETAAPATGTAAAPTPNRADPTAGLEIVPVYRDGLSNSWTLTNSVLVDYLTRSTAFVDEGRYALEAKALADFSTLYFTVRSDAKERFERDRVIGLRFRLTGGDAPIGSEDLAVAVIGSNGQAYWLKDDSSVESVGPVTLESPLFSETRLYFLGINDAIPAGEWTEIIVWLDELIYDPDYEFLTGFYLKTDGLERFFIDDVTLLVAPAAAGG